MDIFPLAVKPDWGFSETPSSNVKQSQLGDGYVYREPVGLNFRKKSWSPVWSSLEIDDGEEAYEFLRLRLNLTPFLYEHPLTGQMIQVVCQDVSKSYDTWGNIALSASFEQDFNPVP